MKGCCLPIGLGGIFFYNQFSEYTKMRKHITIFALLIININYTFGQENKQD